MHCVRKVQDNKFNFDFASIFSDFKVNVQNIEYRTEKWGTSSALALKLLLDCNQLADTTKAVDTCVVPRV